MDLTINHFEQPSIGVIQTMTTNRLIYTTSKRYMGIAPDTSVLGDTIGILFDSQLPATLREEGGHWLFVGLTYVHGIIDGEALKDLDVEKEPQIFHIR